MAFFGRESVLELRDMHNETGKRVAATLKARTSNDTTADVSYANAYLYPITATSGVMGNGAPVQQARLVLFQLGETTAPCEDHRVTVGGHTWEIMSVVSNLTADTNNGVHECAVWRPSTV